MKKPIIQHKDNAEKTPPIGLTKEDLFSAISNVQDAREKVLSSMVDKLFKKDALLMISRLDNDLSNYIVKHLIINNFFMLYWNKIKIDITLTPIEEPPYYKKEYTINTIELPEHIKISYQRLIDELLQITISNQGQGRKEIMEIIKSLEARMIEDKINENKGIVKRLFD